MTFSHATLVMFAELLDNVQVPSTHPNLVAVAKQIETARAELTEALQGVAASAPLAEAEPSPNGHGEPADAST